MSQDTRPVLAFFTTERCGPARRMESVLAHLSRKERDRLRVTRIDVEAKPELAERLRVATIPTLLLIKDKRVVGRIEGRASAPSIERLIDRHLEADRELVGAAAAVAPAA